MLTKIRIQNVKAFEDPQSISCGPLTILTGTNSSGKSTVFQVLLLLKQAFLNPPSRFAGIYFNGKYVTIGAFEDIVSNRRPVSIHLGVDFTSSSYEMDALAVSAGIRSSNQDSTDLEPKLWWEDDVGFVPAKPRSMNASCDISFRPTQLHSSSAMLESFSWKSYAENSGHYDYVVERIEGSILEKYNVDSFGNIDEYRYFVATKQKIPSDYFSVGYRRGKSTQTHEEEIVVSNSLAKFEGIRAVSSIAESTFLAYRNTLIKALSEALTALFRAWKHTLLPTTQTDRRFEPKRHVLNFGSSTKEFERAINFTKKCTTQQLFENIRTYPVDEISQISILAYLIGSVGPRLPEQAQEVRSRFANEYSQRLSGEANALRTTQVNASASETAIGAIVARIKERDLQAEMVSNLLMVIEAVCLAPITSDERLRIKQLLERADRECQQGTKVFGQERGYDESRYYYRHRFRRMAPPSVDILGNFFSYSIFHLGPLREEPRNLYQSEPPSEMSDIGRKGERVIAALRQFGDQKILCPTVEQRSKISVLRLSEAVKTWGQFLGIFDDIKIDSQSKFGTLCQVKTDGGDEIQSDLPNVGVGVSQLLPVIFLCLACPVGSTILIEQPELHLHPAIQTRLGDFFAACAVTGRQLIVETHSEHLINSLRLLRSKGVLKSESDVAISYIKRDTYGARVIQISIMDDGSLSDWPDGFFDESDRVLGELMKSRLYG